MKTVDYANRLSNFVWRLTYCLEEARQECGSAGRLWKQAGCCIALSLLRMIGGKL